MSATEKERQAVRTTRAIKDALKAGRPSIGSWMQLPNSSVAELMGTAGYDWVALDLEHGLFNPGDLPDMVRALEAGGTVPLARVGVNDGLEIKRALEAGVRGVIVPMIDSRAELDLARQYALYPPEGRRGVGYSRANAFGRDFDRHIQNCNEQLILVAQIETLAAVENIEAIVQAPGLDAIMIGPYDLSASLGLTGQFEHAKMQAALAKISEVAGKHNMPTGLHVIQPDPQQLKEKIADGFQWIAYATDAIFLYQRAQRPAI